MISKDILAKVKKMKLSGQKVYSNCYLSFSLEPDREWKTLSNDRSLAIIDYEGGTERLYFYTHDFNDLGKMLNGYDGSPVVDIISKNKRDFEQELKAIGYIPLAHLTRVSNKDVSLVLDDVSESIASYESNVGEYATLEDAKSIGKMLWSIFDTRVSHLPDDNELSEMIAKKEFVVCKNSVGVIESLLQLQISTRSYYVNQIINRGDKNRFHSMVINTLKKYCEMGGKYAYAWVEDTNMASLKFFEKYGMISDGTWNCVYVKENK